MKNKIYYYLIPIFGIAIYLYCRAKSIKVINVPSPVKKSFNSVLESSEYKNTSENWLAVSKMETDRWRSNLFLNGLNLWGMKLPTKRKTTATSTVFGTTGRETWYEALAKKVVGGVSLGWGGAAKAAVQSQTKQSTWAKYPTLDAAVQDIIYWMEYTKFPKEKLSLRAHIEEMKKRSYFQEEVSYYLKAVIAQLKK